MVTPTLTIKALHDRPKHPIDILIAVDIEDQSPFTIEAQERLGSGGKHLEPVRHDVLCIVDPSLLDSSGEQSPREFLERDIQMHDGLQLNRRILFCNSIRGLGLVEISREPIEHVAAIACRLDQRLSEHLKYQIVRYQILFRNLLRSPDAAALRSRGSQSRNGRQAWLPECLCRRRVGQLTTDA
jgi:hypothetical protein